VYSELETSGIKNKHNQPRWKEEWKSARMIALMAFHNQMYGQEQRLVEASDDHLIFARGDSGIVALNKSDHNIEVNMSVGSDVVWLERGSNSYYAPQQGNLRFFIPAHSYMLFSR
jgi:alpha-amylase